MIPRYVVSFEKPNSDVYRELVMRLFRPISIFNDEIFDQNRKLFCKMIWKEMIYATILWNMKEDGNLTFVDLFL